MDIAATMEHRDLEPAAEDLGSGEELSEGQGSEEEEEVQDVEADEEKEESSDEDLVEEEESCGFCLQKLTYMIEPKQLPCSHIFCLPCLQEDPKKDCPVCGRVYGAEWSGMKSYLPSETAGNPIQPITTGKCDICDEHTAVCFCLECEKKLCDSDYKIHERFFAIKHHQQIDISVFYSQTERYKPKLCTWHDEKELVTACYNCRNMFCESCSPQSSQCWASTRQYGAVKTHNIAAIQKIANTLQHKLNEKLRTIADSVTEGLNLEKKTWNDLHEVECDVSRMMSEIDQAVKEAVSIPAVKLIMKLRENADNLKAELRKYQQRCLNQVEVYSAKLREQRDSIEHTWRSTSKKLTDATSSEIVTKYNRLDVNLDSMLPVKYVRKPDLPKMLYFGSSTINGLVSDAFQKTLSVIEPECHELTRINNLVKTDRSASWGGDFKSVTWCADKLIMGTDWEIVTGVPSIGNEWGQSVQKSFCNLDLQCIRSLGPHSVVVCCGKKANNVKERHMRISNSKDIKESWNVYPLDSPSGTITNISVTCKHIAVTNQSEKNVSLYNIEGTKLFTLGSRQLICPWGVSLHDNFVLVTDHKADCLFKYPLEKESTPDWICRDLQSPTGVCADSKGFIYVASSNPLDSNRNKADHTMHLDMKRSCIFLIFPTGELLKTYGRWYMHGFVPYTPMHIPLLVHDMALSDDGGTLALACGKNGVHIYKITKRAYEESDSSEGLLRSTSTKA